MRDLISCFDNRSSIQRSVFDEVDKALNGVFGKGFFPTALSKSTYPKMNVYQHEEALHIDAYVPEVTKENLSLKVEEGILTIEGSVDKKEEISDDRYVCREVSKRSFSRSIQLPDTANIGNIEAEHEDGMLRITIPMPELKSPEKEVLQIKII